MSEQTKCEDPKIRIGRISDEWRGRISGRITFRSSETSDAFAAAHSVLAPR